MNPLAAAFVLGLAGSTHCVLMCGPLVSAVQPRQWPDVAAMQLSRIAVYTVIGAVTGAAGAAVGSLAGGRWLAWMVAATFLLQALASWRGRTGQGPVGRGAGRMLSALSGRLRGQGRWSPVVWGVVNGLLPCGMVYSAATLAAGLASPVAGATTMAAFGLGTVPALVFVARPMSAVIGVLSQKRRWLVPALLVILAALMVVRGAGVSHQDHTAESGHQASSVSHRESARHVTSAHPSAQVPPR